MILNLYAKFFEYYGNKQKEISHLLSIIGYSFENNLFLYEALTHSSAAKEFNRINSLANEEISISWNERLEFLGDSVLSLSVSTYLLNRKEMFPEGELSKIRSTLVNEDSLALLAQKIGVGDCLFFGGVELKGKGREKKSVLADAFEALLGAIYLDSSFQVAEGIINKIYQNNFSNSLEQRVELDFKTKLQEWTQAHYKKTPEYVLISQNGPPHTMVFEMEVWFLQKCMGKGVGKSKKSASQDAAKHALEKLKSHKVSDL